MASLKSPLAGWQKKISRIDKMEIIDCVPNPYAVIVGTAVAAFHVFWAVNGPECIDSTWDRVNKKGKPHRKFVARGTTVGPTINPPAGQFGATMVSLGNLAQKIGFAFGIIDGFIEGIYYGSSMARRYSGCRNITAPYAELDMPFTVVMLQPAGRYIINTWHRKSDRVFIGGPTGVGVGNVGTQGVSVGYHLNQVKNAFPGIPDCNFTSQLIWLPSGSPVKMNWAGLGSIGSLAGWSQVMDIIPTLSDSVVGVAVDKTEGLLVVDSATMTVVGGNIDSGLAAYDCGAKLGTLN